MGKAAGPNHCNPVIGTPQTFRSQRRLSVASSYEGDSTTITFTTPSAAYYSVQVLCSTTLPVSAQIMITRATE